MVLEKGDTGWVVKIMAEEMDAVAMAMDLHLLSLQ